MPRCSEFLVTHIQFDEISQTSETRRKQELLDVISKLVDREIPTESAVFGTSRFGKSKVSDGTLYKKIKEELDAENGCRENNVNDALIAEAAIKNNYVLLTADRDLKKIAERNGCDVWFWG